MDEEEWREDEKVMNRGKEDLKKVTAKRGKKRWTENE